MKERRTNLPVGVELTTQQIRVNTLLRRPKVRKELYDTRRKAAFSRTSSRNEILKDPPRFLFVSGYHAAIYDPEAGSVYKGSWSDSHSSIARDKGLAGPEDSWGNKHYVSCDVFCLRAARGIKVVILYTLYGIRGQDVRRIRELGYEVMGPQYQWLIETENGRGEARYIEVPSSLTTRDKLLTI